jgi:hypothetical protein
VPLSAWSNSCLGLLDCEDESITILRYISNYSPSDRVSHLRGLKSSQHSLLVRYKHYAAIYYLYLLPWNSGGRFLRTRPHGITS